MTIALVFLLAGLIVTGIAIPSFFVPIGTPRSFGVKAQFFFGICLILLFVLMSAGLLRV